MFMLDSLVFNVNGITDEDWVETFDEFLKLKCLAF